MTRMYKKGIFAQIYKEAPAQIPERRDGKGMVIRELDLLQRIKRAGCRRVDRRVESRLAGDLCPTFERMNEQECPSNTTKRGLSQRS